jgi:hypothetical protein
VIDGEIVALDETSKPSFNLLQELGNAQAILYAFDLLMPRRKDVRFPAFRRAVRTASRDRSATSDHHLLLGNMQRTAYRFPN